MIDAVSAAMPILLAVFMLAVWAVFSAGKWVYFHVPWGPQLLAAYPVVGLAIGLRMAWKHPDRKQRPWPSLCRGIFTWPLELLREPKNDRPAAGPRRRRRGEYISGGRDDLDFYE